MSIMYENKALLRSLVFSPVFFPIKFCFAPQETFTVHQIENRVDKYLHFQIKHLIDCYALFSMDCFSNARGLQLSGRAPASPRWPAVRLNSLALPGK